MSYKVLIIDDEEMVRRNLRLLLDHSLQAEVLEATNGKEGLNTLGQHKDIDLIIVDIFMPEMDGLEFIRSARKLDKDIKILAISGGSSNLSPDFLTHAKAMGATDALHKPFELEHFAKVVKKLLDEGRENS